MDDDFYEPLPTTNSVAQSLGSLSGIWNLILSSPLAFLGTALLILPLVFIALRPNKKASDESHDGDTGTVWMVPYSIPLVGHWIQYLYDPTKLMREARDRSAHSVFALKFGTATHNIISDPALVASIMQKDESALQPDPTAWEVLQKCFGVPQRSKEKYSLTWDKLQSTLGYLMQEPHLSTILKSTVRNIQENIPHMISFTDSDIDLHPWERSADSSYISNSETEINLMSLMRDMLGAASVPAVFGRGLAEKYPDIVQDLYGMDDGMPYFMMGLPAWTPWPAVNSAYLARQRVLRGLDGLQEALDATVDEKPVDSSWGDLDDVSEFIMKRHALYKENGFDVAERADISVLWAIVINADLIVYWQLLYILSTPGLVDRLRSELTPYAQVTKPESIGSFVEAPRLSISHEDLSKKCPLFKSTYYEALRLSARPSSTRKVTTDITISKDTPEKTDSLSYTLHAGEYVTIPHDLHMLDPKYFQDPDVFNPERFLVQNNKDGSSSSTQSAQMGSMTPYGAGGSMCKGRILAERECLSLVSGVLVCWDIEPANKKAGWVIPGKVRTSAVCRPTRETRVRIKPRAFKWDE